MPTFHFDPSARLQQFLGRELIADPNIAIIEFVKNAYDAGATEVTLKFDKLNRYKQNQIITIADNGMGMSREAFNRNWMHPGFSYKARGERATTISSSNVAAYAEHRVPSGEKGLGRLAAGRLAEKLEVFTRESTGQPWLHVIFDWTQFKDMNKSLSEIEIPYDETTEPENPKYQTGTILLLSNLTLDWERRIPGRKARNRSDERLGRLWEDLKILAQPLELAPHGFSIFLAIDSWADRLQIYAGKVPSDVLQLLDYQYDFAVKRVSDRIYIDWTIRRSETIALETGQAQSANDQQQIEVIASDIEEGAEKNRSDEREQDSEGRPNMLRCGAFNGSFFYSASSLSAKRARDLGISPGVFLYRDGLRVDPYGQEDDDWLGAKARKASRQGHAAIQPNNFAGYVKISKAENETLIDMSNRQGLLENDAYNDFLAFVRAEFRRFEEIVLEEYTVPNWEQPEQRAHLAALRARNFGAAMSSAILHSLRQPVAGLGNDLTLLKRIISSESLSTEVQETLVNLHMRASGHLRRIDETLAGFFRFDRDAVAQEIQEIDLREVITEAMASVQLVAVSHNVQVILVDGPPSSVVFEKHALVQAIAELINNGIQVPRSDESGPKWVKISAYKIGSEGFEITVSDNGLGMSQEVQDGLFRTDISTKGRPGFGLRNLNQLLALFGASYRLVETNQNGSTVAIFLRSDASLRKELK